MASITDAVWASGDHDRSRTAVIDLGKAGRRVDYGQLQTLVDLTRSKLGIKRGDNVAFLMPNSLELIVGLLAVWTAGAAAAPLNPAYTSAELRVRLCQPHSRPLYSVLTLHSQTLLEELNVDKVLILPGADELKSRVKEASSKVEVVEVEVDVKGSQPPSANGETKHPSQLGDQIALYLHTARNVVETYNLDATYRTYLLQVLFHIHGIVAALLGPLISGGSIVIPPNGSLDASRAWFDIAEQGCNWVTGTPSILQTLLVAPAPDSLPSMRFIRSCSSPLLPTAFDKLHKRFGCPIVEAFAMTEASHQMCSNRLDLFASGTVGPESSGTKVCIWNCGTRSSDLGVEGEVCVSGENVMHGYQGVSPETNDKAFWDGQDERGNSGHWFRTGDTGVLSTDGHRRLTLIGRLSEMVNRGGEKIAPVEVDEAMMLATDDIKEAASFAVQDDFYGQEIEAAVVVKDSSKLSELALQDLLEKRLAKFKIPKRIHFCKDKVPKGPTGKIQRKELAKAFGGRSEQCSNGEKGDEDVFAMIDDVLGLTSGQAKAHPKATLLELGADSMSLARLVQKIFRTTGVLLSMAELFSFPSVGKVAERVRTGTASSPGENGSASAPAPFSLLPFGQDRLGKVCDEAGVRMEDLEDAFPHSASQWAFFAAFAGEEQDNDLMWMLNRYEVSEGTDSERLLRALRRAEEHEESLRWTMATSSETGWLTLQVRPGAESRTEQLQCGSEDEAKKSLEGRLASCKHVPGARTAAMYVVHIGTKLELAFIESHGFTEGRARTEILDTVEKAYSDDAFAGYTPYSAFVQRYPREDDAHHASPFWKKEAAAVECSESDDWHSKANSLINSPRLAAERLELLGVADSVDGPFTELSVQMGMTLPLIVEAVFALSLALYLAQQGPEFARGHVVYDRAISMRSGDPEFSTLRALTGAYLPNFVLLDVAKRSLWSYVQYFKAQTQQREQNPCVNAMPTIAHHSTAFTWRFNNDGEASKDNKTAPLLTTVKDEKMAVRAYKMCFVNANRKGPNGVTVEMGFQRQWVEDRQRMGCRVELMDVFTGALKFFAERAGDVQGLNWADLETVVTKAEGKK